MLPNNHNSDKITAGLMLTQLFCCGGFFSERERKCMDDEAKNKNDVIAAVKSFTILLLC